MANLIGESFKPYVAQQITTRQQKLGQTQKSNADLIFRGSNSPFIKLTSGVNISEGKCSELEIDTSFASNNLAKETILFGGTFSENSGPKLGVATNYNTSPFSKSSYGFVSNSDYGLVPMPGILSANVKSLNRGSIRECEIKLKCYNRFQFNIIEALFLRLKYSFLLEFGHTIYYDNEGNPNRSQIESYSRNFLEGGKTQTQILDNLEILRKKSSGNYDAFLGYVKNFNWSINTDGSYDITIKGITQGDVIESIKVNTKLHDSEKEEEEGETSLEKNKDKTTLNQIFHSLKKKSSEFDGFFTEVSYVDIPQITPDLLPSTFPPLEGERLKDWNKSSEGVEKEAIRLEFSFNAEETGEEQLYIKLGTLLKIIRFFGLIYDTSKPSMPPVVDIDYDFDTNICFTIPEQIPTDPRVCIIPPLINPDAIDKGKSGFANMFNYITLNSTSRNAQDFIKGIGLQYKTDQPFVAKLMHIHVNCNYVSQILDQNQDENGDVDLYTFLSKLVEGIQRSVGGINKFMVNHDKDTNKIVIRDTTHIPGAFNYLNSITSTTPPTPPPPTRINTTLLTNKEGTFVYDVGIKSAITKDIANMITVGAQANGNVVGENATAFSKWNEGLIDRVIPEKQNEPLTSPNNTPTTSLSPQEKFQEYQKNVFKYLNRLVRLSLDEEDINTYSTSFRPYLRYVVGELSKEPENGGLPIIPPIGFIPLSLDIKMLGLSGIKIYQKYTITEDYLPPNYKNKIEFLTKGVSHTIDTNTWTTTIDGQSIPKPISQADNGQLEQDTKGILNSLANAVQASQASFGDYADQAARETFDAVSEFSEDIQDFFGFNDRPNADYLRKVIKDLKYSEKHIPGYKEGELTSARDDIKKPVSLYAAAVLKEVKKQLPDINIVVTSGDDRYHDKLNYTSRHKKGEAVDFVIYPTPQYNASTDKFDDVSEQYIDTIEKILQGFAAVNDGYASYLNEYRDPTAAASAPHFHISWRRGTEGKQQINKAIQLYQQGKIKGFKLNLQTGEVT